MLFYVSAAVLSVSASFVKEREKNASNTVYVYDLDVFKFT